MNDNHERIRAILREHARLSQDPSKLGDDADLYQAGMTSHASVNVMLALEGEFDVEFPDHMLKRNVFESVNAIGAAIEDARNYPHSTPPLHIRNAPTGLMKRLGYGKDYKYAHSFGGFVRQEYLPSELRGRVYYHPTVNGGEKKIHDRLRALWPERYEEDEGEKG